MKSEISRGGLTVEVTQQQVDAFRLRRHRLAPRAPAADAVATVTSVVGLQAQVASAAELMLWARSDGLRRSELDRLLWEERALAKTWAMRGTLHVVPPEDVGLLGAARGGYAAFPANWLNYYKLTMAEFDALMEATTSVLSVEPQSRRQLADAVTAVAGPKLGERLLSGWGEFLKPLARGGVLVSGPPRGQEATFVSAEAWLGPQRRWSPAEAWREAIRNGPLALVQLAAEQIEGHG